MLAAGGVADEGESADSRIVAAGIVIDHRVCSIAVFNVPVVLSKSATVGGGGGFPLQAVRSLSGFARPAL